MQKPSSSQISQKERYLGIRNVTILAVTINILLTLIKIIFGIVGHSQALIADGLHSFSDLIAGGMTLVAAKYSTQPPDIEHPYGHARFETLVTIAVGGLLLLMAMGLFIEAQSRLFESTHVLRPTSITLAAAILSILVKEALFHYTIYIADRVQSPMLRANAWHHRSDAISSIIVFIGVAGSMLGYLWLDAVATIGICLMIGYIGLALSLPGINELVDTGLKKHQLIEIKDIIQSVEGVRALDQLRSRKMGVKVLVDTHIRVDAHISISEAHKIAETVRTQLITQIENIVDVLVHLDLENNQKAQSILNLPFRNEITAHLQQRWQSLKAANAIEQITLHYLSGKLTIDIDLPLTIVQDIKEAQLLSQRLTELVADDPIIDTINIYYRSTTHKPISILKITELHKLMGL